MSEKQLKKIKKGRGRPPKPQWMHDLVALEILRPTNKDKAPKALAIHLTKIIEEKGEIPPEESTLVKWIGELRNQPENKIDEPWSLADLVQHPIQPEAMPAVMRSYKEGLQEIRRLSIREAQWIARLYKVIAPPELVLPWAWKYALHERLSELVKRPFDTTRLDEMLLSDPGSVVKQYNEQLTADYTWEIARKHRADFEKLFELGTLDDGSLSLVEIEEAARLGKYPDTLGFWDKFEGPEGDTPEF